MKLKEIEEKLKGNFDITKFKHNETFVIGLGKAGTLQVSYVDGEFSKLIVEGKNSEEIKKLLKF